MSDTPRTDGIEMDAGTLLLHAQQLERELAAANETRDRAIAEVKRRADGWSIQYRAFCDDLKALRSNLAAAQAKSEERRVVLERNEHCITSESGEWKVCPECQYTKGWHHQTCVWAKAMKEDL
jgi:hypothetical protein